MRTSGTMDQIIMHCIFVGPAGVGKSSLMKRLLHMKLDSKRTSTQAAEKSVHIEVIRDVSTTAAQSLGLRWQKLEDSISQASGLIGQFSAEQKAKKERKDSTALNLSKCVPEQIGYISEAKTLCKQPILTSSEKKQLEDPITKASGQLSTKQEKTIKEENRFTVGDPSKPIIEQISETNLLSPSEHTTSKDPDSKPTQQPQFSKTIDFFRHVLNKKGVSEFKKHDNSSTLYLTDSGGQPEFQELLPALVVGPCVFFVVFPLHKDLKQKFQVEYMRPNERKCMQIYISSLTVQEDILRSLASIACTKYQDKDGNEIKPRVLLVATFKDKVPQKEVRQKRLKELQNLVKETDAFHQGMIVDASESQMVFTINNADDNESKKDAMQIRDALQKLADGFEVHIPPPWLIFSILVQHEYAKQSVISKSECFAVARECGIRNEIEFEAALQFLHKQTGVLHYYKEPPELSQIVIRDPQNLFSRVNHLIEKTFTFEETRSSQCTEDFKKGIFSRVDYEMLTKEFNSSKLNPSMLLKLLTHLNVVVPLGDGEKYFMPCAITHLKEGTAIGLTQTAIVPPLLITFKCGYCPKGLFGALVTCIANKQVAKCTLRLEESRIYRDQICFTVDQYSLLLKFNSTYILIEVVPYRPDTPLSTLSSRCNDVCKLILDNIKNACKTLNYSDKANCYLAFKCPCDQHDEFHPAILRYDLNDCFQCSRSKKMVDVRKECYVWLPQVSMWSTA